MAQYGVYSVRSRKSLKRRLPAGQLIEDDPKAKDVATVVDALAPSLFGRHIGHRSHDFASNRLSTGERLNVTPFARLRLHLLG